MRGVTWVTWCVWGVRPWGMFTSSSDRRDTVLDTILETHPTIPSYSIGYTIPCFPLLSYTFFHHSLAGHCTGHYSGDTLSHTILYYRYISHNLHEPLILCRTLCYDSRDMQNHTICKPRRPLMGLIWLYALLTILMCFGYRLEGLIGGLTNLNVQVFQIFILHKRRPYNCRENTFCATLYGVCACMVASVRVLYASVQWCPPEAIGRCNAAVTKVIFLASGSPLMARTTMKIITKWQLIVDPIFNIQLFSHFNFPVTAMANWW